MANQAFKAPDGLNRVGCPNVSGPRERSELIIRLRSEDQRDWDERSGDEPPSGEYHMNQRTTSAPVAVSEWMKRLELSMRNCAANSW